MPLWIELTVLLLLTYGLGFAIGWALWSRRSTPAGDT